MIVVEKGGKGYWKRVVVGGDAMKGTSIDR